VSVVAPYLPLVGYGIRATQRAEARQSTIIPVGCFALRTKEAGAWFSIRDGVDTGARKREVVPTDSAVMAIAVHFPVLHTQSSLIRPQSLRSFHEPVPARNSERGENAFGHERIGMGESLGIGLALPTDDDHAADGVPLVVQVRPRENEVVVQ
jgi:hypothetical protein